MTSSDIEEMVVEFMKQHPDLPNPKNQPRQVAYLVRTYLFRKGLLK